MPLTITRIHATAKWYTYTSDKWHIRYAALLDELLRSICQEDTVGAREPSQPEGLRTRVSSDGHPKQGHITYLVSKDAWSLVDGSLERVKVDLPQTLQSVRGARAPSRRHDTIIITLSVGDVADRDGRPGLHERASEEAFRIATVRDEVQRGGDRPSALAPSADKMNRKGGDAISERTCGPTTQHGK